MPYYDVFNEEICISVNMSVSIAMRVVYLCVFISCNALMVQCTTNIYFLLLFTRGFPHFDGGEYFVWPMYVCSVLSIGKEGLSEFI